MQLQGHKCLTPDASRQGKKAGQAVKPAMKLLHLAMFRNDTTTLLAKLATLLCR